MHICLHREQEYEKKRSEWLKKKDELRKIELEQKHEKELRAKEIADMEQQERLKNSKVKTFEEWSSEKEEILKYVVHPLPFIPKREFLHQAMVCPRWSSLADQALARH